MPSTLSLSLTPTHFLLRCFINRYNAQTYIWLFGIAGPVVLGLIWLILLRFFARTIVWVSVLSIGAALALCTLYLFLTSGALDELMAQVAGNRTGFGSLISSAADSLGDLGIEVGSGVVNSVTSAADSAAASAASATAQATAAAQSSTESFVQLAPDAVSEAQDQQATSNPFLYRMAGWVCLVLTVIYLIIICIARNKIKLAAILVKESTCVIRDRAISLLFPFVILAVQIPIVIYFMLFLILLGTANLNISHFVASAGDIITASSSYVDQISSLTGGGPVNLTRVVVNGTLLGSNGTIAGMQIPPDSRWVAYGVLLYFLFGVLWVLESSRNVGWTALSGSYSDWYFFRSLSPPSTTLHHPSHHPPSTLPPPTLSTGTSSGATLR